jgi:hypothetical protein
MGFSFNGMPPQLSTSLRGRLEDNSLRASLSESLGDALNIFGFGYHVGTSKPQSQLNGWPSNLAFIPRLATVAVTTLRTRDNSDPDGSIEG